LKYQIFYIKYIYILMWALYNSYHYDCLDRSNYQKKENKSEIKKKKTIYNPERQNYDDIFCQGNKILYEF